MLNVINNDCISITYVLDTLYTKSEADDFIGNIELTTIYTKTETQTNYVNKSHTTTNYYDKVTMDPMIFPELI